MRMDKTIKHKAGRGTRLWEWEIDSEIGELKDWD